MCLTGADASISRERLRSCAKAKPPDGNTSTVHLETTAPRDSRPRYVSYGSWLCENSSARRARRNNSKELRTMESKRAPRTVFDTLLENCIFYIAQLYEFSHRLGQEQTSPAIGSRATISGPVIVSPARLIAAA